MSLAWLPDRYPELPYSLAGFSFGSRIVLQIACGDRDARLLSRSASPLHTKIAIISKIVVPEDVHPKYP